MIGPVEHRPELIVSGGQTGVDRAALEVAAALGYAIGGWCPQGRWAEDGPIPERFPLRETPSRRVVVRTQWNVRDSDATVAFSTAKEMTAGTAFTARVASRLGKPFLHLARERDVDPASRFATFLREVRPRVLNVAGPRASSDPAAAAFAAAVLGRVLGGD